MTHDDRHNSLGIHGFHKHEQAHNIRRIAMLKQFRRLSLAVLGFLVLAMGVVFVARGFNGHALHEITEEASKLHVVYLTPTLGAQKKMLELPGTLQGFAETSIYARSSGFVSKWYKDIGDRVKAGELLATISAPELQQQLEEAMANRAQSATTLELARTSYERWKAMRQSDAVSQQDFDERNNAFKVAQANYAAVNANVLRLEKLVQYLRVVAPFDGVITRRNIDTGTLVDAGNGGLPKLLFNISQSKSLRLYVSVPQMYASDVRVGDAAEIRLAELPGQVFKGKVERTAGAIDPASRTLQVEVDLSNDKGVLMPGSYVTVSLQVKSGSAQTLVIPNNTLLFRPDAVYVACVVDGKSQLKPVKLGSDLGTHIQIVEGLSPSDQVIVNPPDSILNDLPLIASPFQLTTQPKAPASAPAAAASAAASGARP